MVEVGGFIDDWNPISVAVPLSAARVGWLLKRMERLRNGQDEGAPTLIEEVYRDWSPKYYSDSLPENEADWELRTNGEPESPKGPRTMSYSWTCVCADEVWWKGLGQYEDMPVRSESIRRTDLLHLRCCLVPDHEVDHAFLKFATSAPASALVALREGIRIPGYPESVLLEPRLTDDVLTTLLASDDPSVREGALRLLPLSRRPVAR
jgi:hypothetical protein